MTDQKYLEAVLAEQIIQTGILRHDDEKCFWTDAYYSTKKEMERLYKTYGIEIDHFAQDGLTPLFAGKVNSWNEEQFNIWSEYYYTVFVGKNLYWEQVIMLL